MEKQLKEAGEDENTIAQITKLVGISAQTLSVFLDENAFRKMAVVAAALVEDYYCSSITRIFRVLLRNKESETLSGRGRAVLEKVLDKLVEEEKGFCDFDSFRKIMLPELEKEEHPGSTQGSTEDEEVL